jgi:hypothetical protein
VLFAEDGVNIALHTSVDKMKDWQEMWEKVGEVNNTDIYITMMIISIESSANLIRGGADKSWLYK